MIQRIRFWWRKLRGRDRYTLDMMGSWLTSEDGHAYWLPFDEKIPCLRFGGTPHGPEWWFTTEQVEYLAFCLWRTRLLELRVRRVY